MGRGTRLLSGGSDETCDGVAEHTNAPYFGSISHLIGDSQNEDLRKFGLWAFCLLLAWQLALVWAFPRFVSQDGPSHLYNATLIGHRHDPAWGRLPEFYHLNRRRLPNWLTFAMLAELLKFFAPPTAEKMVVTGYFVLFPLTFLYALKPLARNPWTFALWGLIFANNWFFAMGFYNFGYGVALFLFCLGYWLRHCYGFRLKHAAILFPFACLLYFSHLFVFLMASLFVGLASLWIGYSRKEFVGGASFARRFGELARRCVVPQLAFLPNIVLFLCTSTGSQPPFDPGVQTIAKRLLLFRNLHVLVDTRGIDAIVRMTLIGIFLVSATYVVLTRRTSRDVPEAHSDQVLKRQSANEAASGLGFVALVCVALCLFLPWAISGGGALPERMAYFALCAWVLWLASQRWSITAQRRTLAVSIAIILVGLVSQSHWRARLSPLVGAYDEASRDVAPGKTILSLCYCNPENNSRDIADLRIRPLEHAGDIVALAGREYSLDNYEAMGSAFPMEYDARVNPALHSRTISAALVTSKPQQVDIADYEAKTGKIVDYVLVWGAPVRQSVGENSTLDREIASKYEGVYSSSPPAQLRLFKRKEQP